MKKTSEKQNVLSNNMKRVLLSTAILASIGVGASVTQSKTFAATDQNTTENTKGVTATAQSAQAAMPQSAQATATSAAQNSQATSQAVSGAQNTASQATDTDQVNQNSQAVNDSTQNTVSQAPVIDNVASQATNDSQAASQAPVSDAANNASQAAPINVDSTQAQTPVQNADGTVSYTITPIINGQAGETYTVTGKPGDKGEYQAIQDADGNYYVAKAGNTFTYGDSNVTEDVQYIVSNSSLTLTSNVPGHESETIYGSTKQADHGAYNETLPYVVTGNDGKTYNLTSYVDSEGVTHQINSQTDAVISGNFIGNQNIQLNYEVAPSDDVLLPTGAGAWAHGYISLIPGTFIDVSAGAGAGLFGFGAGGQITIGSIFGSITIGNIFAVGPTGAAIVIGFSVNGDPILVPLGAEADAGAGASLTGVGAVGGAAGAVVTPGGAAAGAAAGEVSADGSASGAAVGGAATIIGSGAGAVAGHTDNIIDTIGNAIGNAIDSIGDALSNLFGW